MLFRSLRQIWNVLNEEVGTRQRKRVHWQDVAYASVTFTASAGVWTVTAGQMVAYKYALLQDLLLISWDFESSTTGVGMTTELIFTLPNNLKAVTSAAGWTGFHEFKTSGGSGEVGFSIIQASPNNNRVSLQRPALTNWPSSDTLTSLRGNMMLQVL